MTIKIRADEIIAGDMVHYHACSENTGFKMTEVSGVVASIEKARMGKGFIISLRFTNGKTFKPAASTTLKVER